jgi:hypothetical protein
MSAVIPTHHVLVGPGAKGALTCEKSSGCTTRHAKDVVYDGMTMCRKNLNLVLKAYKTKNGNN